MDRLLYATPSGGNPKDKMIACVRAVDMTLRTFGVRGVDDYRIVNAPVQMARSKMAEAVLDEKFDYLLMHDDDLIVGPGDENDAWAKHGNPVDVWHRLMQADPSVGVIGAVYMREKPIMPNVTIQHPNYPEELCHALCGFPDAPVEVGGIGTGFMLIRKEVFQAISEMEESIGGPPMFRFPFDQSRWGMATVAGEDYDFCRRARLAGFKVVADPRYRTVHLKGRGELSFDRVSWETTWEMFHAEDPIIREVRDNVPDTFKLERFGDFLCMDHTPQRHIDGAAYQARQRAKVKAA